VIVMVLLLPETKGRELEFIGRPLTAHNNSKRSIAGPAAGGDLRHD
jgi:hypothetical protein